MSLMEARDELTTEITSDIDILVNLYSTGLSTSIYIDEELFSEDVSWEQMAEGLIEDYQDDVLTTRDVDDIIGGLRFIIEALEASRTMKKMG